MSESNADATISSTPLTSTTIGPRPRSIRAIFRPSSSLSDRFASTTPQTFMTVVPWLTS
jgi:hypothetical protein